MNDNFDPLTPKAVRVSEEEEDSHSVNSPHPSNSSNSNQGCEPLNLTPPTLDFIHLTVTPNAQTATLVEKKKLQQDIEKKGVLSDFYALKDSIASYSQGDLLVVSDPQESLGKPFFLCLTSAAQERFLYIATLTQALHPSIAQKNASNNTALNLVSNNVSDVNIRSVRDWVSLGSEEEVDTFKIVQNRDLLKISITCKRREFGRNTVKFTDRDSHDGLVECRPFKNTNFELTRKLQDVAVNSVPELCDHSTQTPWFRKVNTATQYTPLTFENSTHPIPQSTEIQDFLNRVYPLISEALKQNSTLNIFTPDLPTSWGKSGNDDENSSVLLVGGVDDNELKEFQSFTDLVYSKNKCISSIDWMPSSKGVIAVTCISLANIEDTMQSHLSRATGISRANIESRSSADTDFYTSTSLNNTITNTKMANIESNTPPTVLIWNFLDPIHPQLILEAPSDVWCVKFHPTKQNIIIGGCANGQVVYWDTLEAMDEIRIGKNNNNNNNTNNLTKKSKNNGHNLSNLINNNGGNMKDENKATVVLYKLSSSIEGSHRKPVSDLIWIKNGYEVNSKGKISVSEIDHNSEGNEVNQFMTVASDGQVLIWDIRFKRDMKGMDLNWLPLYRVALVHGDTKLEYSLAQLSISNILTEQLASPRSNANVPHNLTKLVVTTEDGEIVNAEWGTDQTDQNSRILWASQAHTSSCTSLHQSPFFDDVYMTAGDWSFSIWKTGVNSPLITSSFGSPAVTTTRWSPTRPGVLFVGKSDGTLDIWDIIDRTHLPSLSQTISSSSLSSMEFLISNNSTSSVYLAVGDVSGTLHILEIPKSLVRALPNERNVVDMLLKREVQRVEYAEIRSDIRRKELFDKELGMNEKMNNENNNITNVSMLQKLEDEEKEENQYRQMVEAFKKEMNIIDR